MVRGRKPRPTHLKALEGVKESRLNRQEPIAGEGVVLPPVPLPEDAQAVWDRLVPDLVARGGMCHWDVDMMSVFCRSVALFNRAATEVQQSGLLVDGSVKDTRVVHPALRVMAAMAKTMTSIGSSFGLTPADRARLRVDGNVGTKAGAARLLDGYIR
jgi:P27 family predicted phage terminase small subunit